MTFFYTDNNAILSIYKYLKRHSITFKYYVDNIETNTVTNPIYARPIYYILYHKILSIRKSH